MFFINFKYFVIALTFQQWPVVLASMMKPDDNFVRIPIFLSVF